MIFIDRKHNLNTIEHFSKVSYHIEFVIDFYLKIFAGVASSKARTKTTMYNLIYNVHKIQMNKHTFNSLVSVILKGEKVNKQYSAYTHEIIRILNLIDTPTRKKLVEGLPDDVSIDSFLKAENDLIVEIQKVSPSLVYIDPASGNLMISNLLRNLTNKIFDYSLLEGNGLLSSATERYNLYDLLEGLDIRSCPYCNRQFTFTLVAEVKGKRKTLTEEIIKPEIDHFYPQKYHPFLTISYYNLIPSCGTCNKSKLDSDIKPQLLIHPYIEGFENDALFIQKPLSYKEIKGYTSTGVVRLIVDTADALKKARIEENIKLFKLDKVYQAHSDHAADIVSVKDELGGSYLEHIRDLFLNKGIIKSDAEIYKVAYLNYYDKKDFDKKILSKLTYDISIMSDTEV